MLFILKIFEVKNCPKLGPTQTSTVIGTSYAETSYQVRKNELKQLHDDHIMAGGITSWAGCTNYPGNMANAMLLKICHVFCHVFEVAMFLAMFFDFC